MKNIIALSSVPLVMTLGNSMLIPVLPMMEKKLSVTSFQVSLIITVYSVVAIICIPIAGYLSDRFGRKKMIILGLLIFSLSELIFGLGTHVSIFYFSRILGGVSAAFIMPAVTAYVADITTLKERSKAMGYVSAAISTGFIIGPGAGGFIAGFGIRMPFFFASAIALIAAVTSVFILKESLSIEERHQLSSHTKESNFIKDLKRSIHPVYFIAFIIVFVMAFGLSAYETVFSLFSDHKFGFTPKDIAAIITISSIVAVVIQVLLFGKLVNKLGEKRMIQLCLITGAILAFVSTVMSGFLTVLLVTCFIFLAFDLLRPALTAHLSNMAGNQQGFVAGMNSTYTSLGNIFGPALGGILFDLNIHYPFLFAGFVMIVGLGLTMVWKEKKNDAAALN
ncbi:MFS transporter [Bacillus subtilis]|uniref:MFS transporter n=1 Tax=Bacillus subtilis TaxID=1423 RepID=UPI002DBEFCA3|nr:MFS transporter [Bacillus subtilis]MEC1961020.1 MFS transporter [Bacillus subtilis]